MDFTEDQVRIEGKHVAVNWDSANYLVGDVILFHERTYIPRSLSGSIFTEQWMPGIADKPELTALAVKYGGRVEEAHYGPGYFLAFSDTDKALAFCRTEDFDALTLSGAKLEAPGEDPLEPVSRSRGCRL